MTAENLPIGFIMSVALNEKALKVFANLDNTTKDNICSYIQSSTNGNEAKQRIDVSVRGLENNNLSFLN